jgi:hypothetical protein
MCTSLLLWGTQWLTFLAALAAAASATASATAAYGPGLVCGLQGDVCFVAEIEKDRSKCFVGVWLPKLVANEHTLLKGGGTVLRLPLQQYRNSTDAAFTRWYWYST